MAELNLPQGFLAELETRPCTQYYAPWKSCGHVYRETWRFNCRKAINEEDCECSIAPKMERCNVTYTGREGYIEPRGKGIFKSRCDSCEREAKGKAKITDEVYKK